MVCLQASQRTTQGTAALGDTETCSEVEVGLNLRRSILGDETIVDDFSQHVADSLNAAWLVGQHKGSMVKLLETNGYAQSRKI